MDKVYNHQEHEGKIYELWEKSGAFTAKIDPNKKPYSIALPLPNASGRMHTGNVLMLAVQDLLIRWKRMQGFSACWFPGTDHAGFETQITFERKLKEQGKSRFDYDRKTLYQMIWDFVMENKTLIEDQFKAMGASIDWSRYQFSLGERSVKITLDTFVKMHDDGLIYRDNYLVNYCPICGTTFADIETSHKETTDPLYYIKYPLSDKSGFITVATVRPETMFGDTAVAVNPKDERYKNLVGKKVLLPLTTREIPIIADRSVEIEFGTGALKITPAHAKDDFVIGRTNNLENVSVINMDGKITLPHDTTFREVEGLGVDEARLKTVEELQKLGLIEKIDEKYSHSIAVCYKAGHRIEPLLVPNWFVKVVNIKEKAHQAVKDGSVKIWPKWQEVKYHRWMENMQDWPISRQVVWGIQIPAWYSVSENPNIVVTFLDKNKNTVSGKLGEILNNFSFEEIESGLQSLIAPNDSKYVISKDKPTGNYLQETDTFDTWFSSGQWPLTVTDYPDSPDFKYFYPTDVLETAWEILSRWVSRMIMFGIYLTGKPPFKDVYLHGIVKALDGRKMSKSLGNVINPEEYQEEYGTDALRMGLISGTANGKDFAFPRDKVISYRNFANKLWNIGRLLEILNQKTTDVPQFSDKLDLKEEDREILEKLKQTTKEIDTNLEKFRFADAGNAIYHFLWEDLSNNYLEKTRNREDKNITITVFKEVYFTSLKLLHPFMPFVTETIWQELKDLRQNPEELLIISPWPTTK